LADVVIEADYAAHGVLAWPVIDDTVEIALDQLILPGMEHVGIKVNREIA
jgi:hypothetical protein